MGIQVPEGCEPPVTRLLPMKPTSNAPFMSSSESGSDVSSSSSDDSDDERSTNCDLVVPIPELVNNSEDDAVSPSRQ